MIMKESPNTKVEQHSQTVRTEIGRYLIMIEETATGFSADSPVLPGFVATGRTREEVETEMHDAVVGAFKHP